MKTATIEQFDLLIDGEIRKTNSYFDSINPSTGEVFARIADASSQDVKAAIKAARAAFDSGEWAQLTIQERGKYLNKIAQLIRENAKILADLESLNTGKTLKQ